jgi:hypothetical protein
MEIEMDIFDSKGHVRTDHSPEDIAALPKERQGRYRKLMDAAREAEAAEINLRATTDHLHAAVREHAASVEALQRVKPNPTFLDSWRAAFKGE